jgi:PAS domain S-box-containing protein
MSRPAELSTAAERAQALSRIARSLTTHSGQRETWVREVCDVVRSIMRTNAASLLVLNEVGSAFEWLGHPGMPAAVVSTTVPRETFDSFRPEFTPVLSECDAEKLAADPRMRPYVAHGLRAHATAIVSINERVAGLLLAASYAEPHANFIPDELIWLQTVADIIVQSVERDRAMRETQRSELRYRQIVASIRDGVWSIDGQGRTIYANEQLGKMLGYAPEEMLGRSLFDFMDEAGAKAAREAMARRQQGIAERLELRYKRKDGSDLEAVISAGPLRDAAGNVEGALAVVSDLTEERRLELKMQQAQKLESLGVLAGGIAHDFNNLLVGIMGNVGLAQDDLGPDHPIGPRLEEIRVAALRAAELTRQMLAYSGKGRFTVARLNLSRLVEEMSHLLHTVISKRASVKFEFASEPITVEVDATQIRQVVMNLITNASDALGDNSGVISIRTYVEERPAAASMKSDLDAALTLGHYAVLEVSDTGCGMDPRTLEKIFDPFFTTKFAGRGLGLAAVHGILRSHRGSVHVNSEPGRGTSFKVLLPAVQGAHSVAAPRAEARVEKPAQGLVLVADDELAVRTIAKVALERAGFRVQLAVDGSEALRMFTEQPRAFVAVLLDLTMPKLSGDQVLRELRMLNTSVPVVLSSGYTEQDAAKHVADGVASSFLQKPWLPSELAKAIRDVVERN